MVVCMDIACSNMYVSVNIELLRITNTLGESDPSCKVIMLVGHIA